MARKHARSTSVFSGVFAGHLEGHLAVRISGPAIDCGTRPPSAPGAGEQPEIRRSLTSRQMAPSTSDHRVGAPRPCGMAPSRAMPHRAGPPGEAAIEARRASQESSRGTIHFAPRRYLSRCSRGGSQRRSSSETVEIDEAAPTRPPVVARNVSSEMGWT